MIDFGASTCFKGTSDRVYDTVGTKIYYAPEILARSKDGVKFMYGKRCDIWAAGVTLFEIAAQRNPFHTTEGLMQLMDSILHDEVDYTGLGTQFTCFLEKMLNRDQELRATVDDLLEDEYITNYGQEPLELFSDDTPESSLLQMSSELSNEDLSVVLSVDEMTSQKSVYEQTPFNRHQAICF